MRLWLFEPDQQPKIIKDIDHLFDRGFLWIEANHVELDTVLQKMKQLTGVELHQEHYEDCLNPRHPSFFDAMHSYKLFIYRSLQIHGDDQSFLQTQPVAFILLEKILITFHESEVAVMKQVKRFEDAARLQPKSPDVLLYQLLLNITDKYLSLREQMTTSFGQWQEALLDRSQRFNSWREFLNYKTGIQRFNLLCEGQLDAVGQWQQAIEDDEGDGTLVNVHLADLSSHILRGLKFSQQLQYQIDSLMQLHYSLMTTKTNEVVQLLTVISCIFLPLTLLTGIFGMNFEHMPFLKSEAGFYGLIIFMLAIILLLCVIFKWRRWV